MYTPGAVLQFFGAMLLLTAIGMIVRLVLMKRLSQSPSQNPQPIEVKPSELAYLLREGDMTHTMIVLVVDLIHRSVKSGGDTAIIALQPYEQVVFSNVKEATKRWAQQQVEQVVPLTPTKDPVQWWLRFKAIRDFVLGPLRRVAQDILKDPRHIRKYFTFAGVARLTLDLVAAGYKERVEVELKKELLNRGLLVPEQRRHQFAFAFLALAIVLLILIFVLQGFLLPVGINAFNVFIFALFGFVNGVLLKGLLSIPQFIPAYEEFSRLLADLQREGKRIEVLRLFFRATRTLLWAAVIIIVSLLAVVQVLIATIMSVPPQSTVLFLAAFTTVSFLLVQLLIDAYSLALREHPTTPAQLAVAGVTQRLSRTRPLESFKNVFGSTSYDPELSEIVAVYGIETLWLLS